MKYESLQNTREHTYSKNIIIKNHNQEVFYIFPKFVADK